MGIELTDIECKYLDCIQERDQLIADIAEYRAGAAEEGFGPEIRDERRRWLVIAQAQLVAVEKRAAELKPQFDCDQAKRHARDIEEAQADRRQQQKLKM